MCRSSWIVGVLAAALAASPVRAQDAPAPPPSQSSPGRLLLLPDISAVASGALSWNDYDIAALTPRDGPWSDPRRVTPVFEELELALQAVVDPYARADIFVAFSDEEVHVEEAFLTALTLPGGVVARAGKFFAPFGRMNAQHPHTWEFVDRPLPLQRLLAGEALGGAGVDVAWLAPLPWFAEARLAYQSVAPAPLAFGADGPEPAHARAAVARVVNFLDVTERLAFGAGASGALLEDGEGWRDLVGADVYLKYRPGPAKAYFALQSELVWRRVRDVPEAGSDWGAYAQLTWQVDRRWGMGARWERAPGVVDALLGGVEQRWSGIASFAPSEYQRVRLQAGRTQLPFDRSGLEALLSLEFAIGAHGAHAF